MKQLSHLLIPVIFISLFIACNAQTAEKDTPTLTSNEKNVKVYYFHFTRRCATCLAIEEQTKLAIESLYREQLANGSISFQSVNIDEKDGAKLAEEIGVNGQSLLIVNGKNKTDLVREGFLYARANPEKLKHILKEVIDPLLL